MIKLFREPVHRRRQIRWVAISTVLLLISVLASLAIMYYMGSNRVETEFWHAHKQVHNTGELLWSGVLVSGVVVTVLIALIAVWRFHVTYHVVRPVHILHQALERLVTGNMGVRVQLNEHDEFQEVASAMNQLLDEFSGVLGRLHPLLDEMEALSAEAAPTEAARARLHDLARQANQTMEFFRLEPSEVIKE